MNKVLTLLYVVIKNNCVIAFETNLKGFVELINELIPDAGSYGQFERRFKTDMRFKKEINGETYYFQSFKKSKHGASWQFLINNK